MITAEGPKLIEYNVRFGDPECQVILPRLAGDLLPALLATTDGGLDKVELNWRGETAVCVVMASKGYPGAYEKGSEIGNLDSVEGLRDVIVFHAGTARENGRILATGGRVLGVTALGGDIEQAVERAYQAVRMVDWPEGFCRRDIAWRAIARKG